MKYEDPRVLIAIKCTARSSAEHAAKNASESAGSGCGGKIVRFINLKCINKTINFIYY